MYRERIYVNNGKLLAIPYRACRHVLTQTNKQTFKSTLKRLVRFGTYNALALFRARFKDAFVSIE